MRFIDSFEAILFDMNGTIMFGHDRLGADEDFHATYRRLGGESLSAAQLTGAVENTCKWLSQRYDDARYQDAFPSVWDAVIAVTQLSSSDANRVVSVIAEHERGGIPSDAAAAIRQLSRTHRLGVVSNLWSRAETWRFEFERVGVAPCFETMHFSSSGCSIKPSPVLFCQALESMRLSADKVLFVGDSETRDIVPSSRLGMSTVRVGEVNLDSSATRVVAKIANLLDLP